MVRQRSPRISPRWARTIAGICVAAIAVLYTPSLPAEEPAPYDGWRETRTEHFRIIFEPAHEAAAREVVSFAEEVYDEVTATLGYSPEVVPVVIRGRTASANGFYSPFPHRINLFLTSPSGPWLGPRHESWLRLLLVHELTHYVQFTDRTGFFGGLSRVFGHEVSVFSFPFMPGWYVEALTTLNETRLTTGGRGRNPFFEMQVKAPVLEGKLWSLDQAAYQSAFAPRGRIYISGYVLADYLTRTYGAGTYRRVHREFERLPFFGVGRAVRSVTAEDYEEVYADMHAGLIRRFAGDARLPVGARVSPDGAGNWYLPVVTEAGYFGYGEGPGHRAGIYLYERDDEGLWSHQLILPVAPADPYSFDIDRDASTLVFAVPESSQTHPAGLVSYADLWRYELATGERERITRGERLWHPALSPTGDRLVAVQRQGSYSRLVDVGLQDGSVRVMYEPEQASVLNPRFGPHGRRIVFVEHARGFQDVMIYEDGAARPMRGRDTDGEYFPRFSGPETVIYSSDRNGRLELFSHDLRSGRDRRIVQDRVAAWAGVPAGTTILYGSYTSEGYTVRETAAEPASPPGASTDSDPLVSAPPPAEWDPLPNVRAYRDVPRPLVWAPYLELYADTDDEVRLPAGVYLYGAGILARTSFESILAVDAYAGHPRMLLSGFYAPGPVTLGYTFDYTYRPTGDDYRALLANEVSAGSVPWYRRWPAAASGLSARAAVALESAYEADAAFTADELFSATGTERELDLVTGASLGHAAFAPAAAYFGGFGTTGELEIRYTPPVLDAGEHRMETGFGTNLGVPTGLAHQILRVRAEGVSSTDGSVEGMLLPTSGARWESGDGDAKLRSGLDYRIPLGVYDQPLPGLRPYKPALLGLGATLYAESAVYLDVDAGSLTLEDDLFFGLETEGRFTFMRVPLAGGIGAAVRVDRSFAEPVGTDDWRVYAFLSSAAATRISGGRSGRAARDAAPLPDRLVPAGNTVR